MRILIVLALSWFVVVLPRNDALAADSGAAATRPALTTVTLPGRPFGVAASRDGNWVFVSLLGGRDASTGIAVLQHYRGQFKLKRVIPLQDGAAGLVLTHDGNALIAAAGDSVVVLDTGTMILGSGDPVIAKFSDGDRAGSIYVNVTADDKLLFVSDEGAQTITVVDLPRVRSSGYDAAAVLGKIPVGLAPIALTFSPDDRWLYTTSEGASPDWGWPSTETPEGPNRGRTDEKVPPGAVVVIDVAKARTDPAHSVVARVPAGASPVRMTISPDGRFIYVTARGSNAVLMFDAAKLITDSEHSRLATVTVGASPVPLALIQNGKTLVVGNSNRFGADADKPQTLSVLEVAKMALGDAAIGTIPAGAFPREMCVSSNGQTLFVTNFGSSSLEIIDAQNPPIDFK
jgi:DNA-binding beta-propeller fold protein YncE